MKQELKEVCWGRKYPRTLENERLILKQKTWGKRLIYDVYVRNIEDEPQFLGACHVLEKVKCNACSSGGKCKCKKMKVKELSAPSKEASIKLNKRLFEIEELIHEKI